MLHIFWSGCIKLGKTDFIYNPMFWFEIFKKESNYGIYGRKNGRKS